ncbi:MAG TPA: OPT/YSL family transporter, partial [Myxococcales bacterium]|nr:OPT/YSL family transporter [Myxococcales bacterium]
IPESLAVPGRLAGVPANLLGIGLTTSPLLWGAGIMIGPRITIGMLSGSVLGWIVLGPWLVRGPLHLATDRGAISDWLSWPATALLVGAALVYLLRQAGLIARAVRDLRSVASERSVTPVLFAACAALGALVVGRIVFHLSAWHTGLALLLSVLGSSICARSAGLADFAPLGTVGQATQAAYGALAAGRPAVNVAAASVVAGVPTETCQLLWSLKSGRLLGAPVRGQAAAALLGCVVGTFLCMPAYGLLLSAYGLASPDLPVPTALQWKAMGEVVAQGLAALPAGALRAAVVAGLSGIVLAVIEESPLKRFAPPALAVGIGALLPFDYSLTMFCGAAVVAVSTRLGLGPRPAIAAAAAAGLVAGDSVIGIFVALLRSFGLL